MSVAVNVIGAIRRINPADDEAMLKLCDKLSVGGKKLKLIELELKDGVVRGGLTGGYSIRGFQSVDVVINGGKREVNFTEDLAREPDTSRKIKFTADEYGRRSAYIPDTPFNRSQLVKGTSSVNCSYKIATDGVDTEVEKLAEARIKRRANAIEKAQESAFKIITEQEAVFVKGLEEKYGKAHTGTREYKEIIVPKIKALATKIFNEDKSWEEATKKKPAAANADA